MFLCLVFLMLLASVHCCLVVTSWERADLLALVGDVYCIFVTFPFGILGQVWHLIVSFPDLCCLSYFVYTSIQCSDESARSHRLIPAFAARICDKVIV